MKLQTRNIGLKNKKEREQNKTDKKKSNLKNNNQEKRAEIKETER